MDTNQPGRRPGRNSAAPPPAVPTTDPTTITVPREKGTEETPAFVPNYIAWAAAAADVGLDVERSTYDTTCLPADVDENRTVALVKLSGHARYFHLFVLVDEVKARLVTEFVCPACDATIQDNGVTVLHDIRCTELPGRVDG